MIRSSVAASFIVFIVPSKLGQQCCPNLKFCPILPFRGPIIWFSCASRMPMSGAFTKLRPLPGTGLFASCSGSMVQADKEQVARLSRVGNVVEKPEDIIKNPVTLEFVGLKPDASYSESNLESAIIGKLQEFLLELGKGFLFEARQKRFSFDEDDYYVDLVLYNRLLQCYVLVDLKVDKLTHQDLGQMQMYVNYYDRYVKQDFEKPTIGILLCKEKKDTLVKLTLPENANIYASAYELYLPDKKLLQAKVKEWVNEFESTNATCSRS